MALPPREDMLRQLLTGRRPLRLGAELAALMRGHITRPHMSKKRATKKRVTRRLIAKASRKRNRA